MSAIGKKVISLVLVLTLSFMFIMPSTPAKANMGGFLDQVMNDLKGISPKVYQGQERGYFIGGSISSRFNFKDDPLVSFTPPSVKSGCGGIDIIMGGFSYLNFEYLVQKLQAILQAAPAFAFQLALSVLCPDCKDILDSLDALANMINQLNFDSCHAAKALVGFAGQQLGLGAGNKMSIGINTGWFTGMKEALTNAAESWKKYIENYATQYDCMVLSGGAQKECMKKQNRISFNVPLMTAAMRDASIKYGSGMNFEGFFRAKYGDIYEDRTKGTNDAPPPIVVDPGCEPPKDYKSLLDQIVYGRGVVKAQPSDSLEVNCNYNYEDNKGGLLGRTKDMLVHIRDAIKSGGTLSQTQIDFVNASAIPVYRLLSLYVLLEKIEGDTDSIRTDTYIQKIATPLAFALARYVIEYHHTILEAMVKKVATEKGNISETALMVANEIARKIPETRKEMDTAYKDKWDEFKIIYKSAQEDEIMALATIYKEMAKTKLLESYKFAKGIR